jgi:hypothetical protein
MGLALAREPGLVLAWDRANWLNVWNQEGKRQAQCKFPGTVISACCADDGSALAAAGKRGEIVWFEPDLMSRWQIMLPYRILALAMDSFGQYLAVADQQSQIHVIDRLGKTIAAWKTYFSIRHLAFVPSAPLLIGSADYGLLGCFDLQGKPLWRGSPVANTGGLALSPDGRRIAVACFSDGIQQYDVHGQSLGRRALPEPCRLVSIACGGRFFLAGGMTNCLYILTDRDEPPAMETMPSPIQALALSALGDYLVVALEDGSVTVLRNQRFTAAEPLRSIR